MLSKYAYVSDWKKNQSFMNNVYIHSTKSLKTSSNVVKNSDQTDLNQFYSIVRERHYHAK